MSAAIAAPTPVAGAVPPAVAPAVLSAHGVGKMYRLYDRPQDRLKYQLFWRFGRTWGREFWALRDVSLSVRPGEMLGVIGRNGQGKSTLLQILAGVLQPTAGHVAINGRVAALLELGSGFNPEFTGRENVFLNGAIMGYAREEMAARFDEIAAFADIGPFIDQPVKTYSSGMFVRLAFAVATSVDADVLLIDEALAVGDVFFRQKCYARLESLRARGTAIVLVSHAMLDIEQFCDRVIVLHHGQMAFEGPASEAVKRYYLVEQEERAAALRLASDPTATASASEPATTEFDWPAPEAFVDLTDKPQVANGWARCTAVAVCDAAGAPCRVFEQGETAHFFYEFELLHDIETVIAGIVITNDSGVIVHGKSTLEYDSAVPMMAQHGQRVRLHQRITLELALGEYTFEVGIATMHRADYARRRLLLHHELHTKSIRMCHVPGASDFAVVFRAHGEPVQLLHHGVANLAGGCEVMLAHG